MLAKFPPNSVKMKHPFCTQPWDSSPEIVKKLFKVHNLQNLLSTEFFKLVFNEDFFKLVFNQDISYAKDAAYCHSVAVTFIMHVLDVLIHELFYLASARYTLSAIPAIC